MKEKQFEPAEKNVASPAPGFASVNTHNPGEEPFPASGEERHDPGTGREADKEGEEKPSGTSTGS